MVHDGAAAGVEDGAHQVHGSLAEPLVDDGGLPPPKPPRPRGEDGEAPGARSSEEPEEESLGPVVGGVADGDTRAVCLLEAHQDLTHCRNDAWARLSALVRNGH